MVTEIIGLVPLVLEYGPKLGRFIAEKINSDKEKQEKFLKGLNENLGLSENLKNIFGDKLQELLNEGKKTKKIQYESHVRNYISLDIDENLPKHLKNDLFKAELAENLERLNHDDIDSNEMINRSRVIFNQWVKKYIQLQEPDKKTLKKFQELREILNPSKTTAKDIFKKLKPFFGASGVLTMIYTGLLATATGVGFTASILAMFNILPLGQIFTLAGLTILLGYLALIPIKEEDKIQIVINGIYGIIDDNIEDFAEIIKKEKSKSSNLENINVKQQDYSFVDKNINNELLILIVSLLKHTIWVDGEENKKEKDVFINFMQKNYTLTSNEINSLYEHAPDIHDIEDFIKELYELLPTYEMDAIINNVKEIITADSNLAKEEIKLLNVINDKGFVY